MSTRTQCQKTQSYLVLFLASTGFMTAQNATAAPHESLIPESLAPSTRQPLTPKSRTYSTSLQKVDKSSLPSLLPDFDFTSLRQAVERSLARCERMPTATYTLPDRKVTRTQWCVETMTQIKKWLDLGLTREAFTQKLVDELDWYRSKGRDSLDSKGEVLFTGYYLPLLEVKSQPDHEYKYPLYRKPSDLIQVVEGGRRTWRRLLADGSTGPFYDRREIDEGLALQGRGLEIAYSNDPFAIFITQIQGSGKLRYIDTNPMIETSLNYAAQNGQAYTSIGAHLRDDLGVDPSYLSLQGMRRYFKEHPENLWPVMFHNPSYVFFSEAAVGPFGALGTELVPGHSIAIDPAHFPLGMLAWVKTYKPKVIDGDQATVWESFNRFVVSQDTGGAIKSAGRVDFYWGSGEYEEIAAGQLNHPGELFFAVVKMKQKATKRPRTPAAPTGFKKTKKK